MVTLLAAASVSYISSQFSPASLSSLSKSLVGENGLSESSAVIQSCLSALAKLYSESAKRNHDEAFFRRAISPYSLPVTVANEVTRVYLENRQIVYETVPSKVSSDRQYKSFDYRLDVEIARRAATNVAKVKYNVRVEASDDSVVAFESDEAALYAMKQEVENAIRSEKDTHSQRFQRYLN